MPVEKLPTIPDYTTISRRINKLNIKVEDTVTKESTKAEYIVIAVDSTGIKKHKEANGWKTNGI